MIDIFVAAGCEECEALVTADILRRAELPVCLVAVGGSGEGKVTVTGSHGIRVVCDLAENDLDPAKAQMIVLPGGMPGTLNLEKSAVVQSCIDLAIQNDLWIGAICAAPSILGHRNLLVGQKATCFPGYETQLQGAHYTGGVVEQAGKIITARSMGCAIPFGLALVAALLGRERAAILADSLYCPPGTWEQ